MSPCPYSHSGNGSHNFIPVNDITVGCTACGRIVKVETVTVTTREIDGSEKILRTGNVETSNPEPGQIWVLLYRPSAEEEEPLQCWPYAYTTKEDANQNVARAAAHFGVLPYQVDMERFTFPAEPAPKFKTISEEFIVIPKAGPSSSFRTYEEALYYWNTLGNREQYLMEYSGKSVRSIP